MGGEGKLCRSSFQVVENYRDVVGKNVGILDGLVELLNTARAQGKKDVLRAIFHLALWPANRSRLVSAEAVPVLKALIQSPKAGLIEDTLSVLAKIALCVEGTDALKDDKTILLIIDFLQHGSRSAFLHLFDQEVLVKIAFCCQLDVLDDPDNCPPVREYPSVFKDVNDQNLGFKKVSKFENLMMV
jgi:hypothetical protein